MAFDGFITKSIAIELNSVLISGKIDKIYQPNKNEIILGIYSQGKNYALEMNIDSNSCRTHLTTKAKLNPLSAPNFCMLLRKHLLGYRIKTIQTIDLERILFIELEGRNELNDLTTKKIIVELMGKHSNILLVTANNIIIDTLRHIDSENSTRQLLPAHFYELPSNTKNSFLELADFTDFQNQLEKDTCPYLDKLLCSHFTGFSMPFIQHVLQDLDLSNIDISRETLEKIYYYLKELLSQLETNTISVVPFLKGNGKKDYVLALKSKENPLGINFFLDDFYAEKETNEHFILYRNSLLKIILEILNKYKSRLKNIDEKIVEAQNRNIYQLYGELITSNLYRISKENQKEIVVENYYENNTPITIPLDNRFSPAINAKRYFKKYNKLKTASELAETQKQDTLNQLNYLETILFEIEDCSNIKDFQFIEEELENSGYLEKKNHSFKPSKRKNTITASLLPEPVTIDNHLVYIGKNNQQNDYLTTKFAHFNDIWFHTKDIHGSHVILKADDKEIDSATLTRCAQIAAFHSKGKNSSKVPVDYTLIKYVKKPSKSKPGMVIYTHQKTLFVNPQSE